MPVNHESMLRNIPEDFNLQHRWISRSRGISCCARFNVLEVRLLQVGHTRGVTMHGPKCILWNSHNIGQSLNNTRRRTHFSYICRLPISPMAFHFSFSYGSVKYSKIATNIQWRHSENVGLTPAILSALAPEGFKWQHNLNVDRPVRYWWVSVVSDGKWFSAPRIRRSV